MSTRIAVSQKVVDPTVDQVALDYLKTHSGVKNMIFKPVTSFFDIIGLFSSNPEYKNLAAFSKDAKNFSEIATLPLAMKELDKRITAYSATGTTAALGDLVREIFSFLVPVTDSIKAISNRFVPLSARALSVLGTVGSASTLFSMMFLIDEELIKKEKANQQLASKKLQKDPARLGKIEKAEKAVAEAQIDNSNWLLARNVHYASLGAFGLAGTLLKMASPPPLMVALAAGGAATSIISHFNNKMYLEPAQNRHKALLGRAVAA